MEKYIYPVSLHVLGAPCTLHDRLTCMMYVFLHIQLYTAWKNKDYHVQCSVNGITWIKASQDLCRPEVGA